MAKAAFPSGDTKVYPTTMSEKTNMPDPKDERHLGKVVLGIIALGIAMIGGFIAFDTYRGDGIAKAISAKK